VCGDGGTQPAVYALWDVNGDGCVDDLDLLAVLNAFGSTESAPDVDGDGRVDDADLLIVLFNFDAGC
jgi:Ca2+-binding EF-hand superfamily protein